MPQPDKNGYYAALGQSLIKWSSSYMLTESAVLRHLIFFRNQHKHGLDQDLQTVCSIVQKAYGNNGIQMIRKDQVKAKLSQLYNNYQKCIVKNINNKKNQSYCDFKEV